MVASSAAHRTWQPSGWTVVLLRDEALIALASARRILV
jgi:hypothetical protein